MRSAYVGIRPLPGVRLHQVGPHAVGAVQHDRVTGGLRRLSTRVTARRCGGGRRRGQGRRCGQGRRGERGGGDQEDGTTSHGTLRETRPRVPSPSPRARWHVNGQRWILRNIAVTRLRQTAAHGQAGRLRAACARGARRAVHAAVVHRRARVPQVGRGRAGGAGGRLRGGHRVRRVGDRGLRPRLRGGHARQARPGDVPDPAVAQRRRAEHGADVLRHRDAGRLAVVRRPTARAEADPRQGRRAGLHLLHPPRDRVLPLQGRPDAG